MLVGWTDEEGSGSMSWCLAQGSPTVACIPVPVGGMVVLGWCWGGVRGVGPRERGLSVPSDVSGG